MFNPKRKDIKEKRTYSLSPGVIKAIEEIAEYENSTNSAVVEELVRVFAPQILAHEVED